MKHILARVYDLLYFSCSEYYLKQSSWRMKYEFIASTSETLHVDFLETGEGENIAQISFENFDESPILGIHFVCGTGPFLVPDELNFSVELGKVLGAFEQGKKEVKKPELWNEQGWFKPQKRKE